MTLLSRLLKRARGFSLIELTIIFAVAAAVIGGIWVGTNSLLQKQNIADYIQTVRVMHEHFRRLNYPRPNWTGYIPLTAQDNMAITGVPASCRNNGLGFTCRGGINSRGVNFQLLRLELYWTGPGYLDLLFMTIQNMREDECEEFFLRFATSTYNQSRIYRVFGHTTFPLTLSQIETGCAGGLSNTALYLYI
jgi:type II secretory pathway pseudopilin PulG